MGVGLNLKILRSKTKFSQQDVADFLDIHKNTYISWENEITDVRCQYIPELSKIFDTDISELFKDSKQNPKIENLELFSSGYLNFKDKELRKKVINQIIFLTGILEQLM